MHEFQDLSENLVYAHEMRLKRGLARVIVCFHADKAEVGGICTTYSQYSKAVFRGIGYVHTVGRVLIVSMQ